jgi:uroporphyrin-3 C-methyltransferase
MAETSDTPSENPEAAATQSEDTTQTQPAKKTAAKQDTAKVLDDIAKVRPPMKTRPQRKARSRVIALIVLTLPLLTGIVWLAWQQWQLGSNLPQLEARLALVESGDPSGAQRPAQLSPEQEVQVAALVESARQKITADTQSLIDSIASESLGRGDSQVADDERDRRLIELAAQAAQDALTQLDGRLTQQQVATAAELTRLRNQLAELSARVRAADSDPNRGWELLEAEYLLSIASRKLRFERDVDSAIALYELADVALENSASDESYPLRQTLSGELSSLRAVRLPDTDSLFLRLDILLAQADSLVLAGNSIDSMRANFQAEEIFTAAPETTRETDVENLTPWQLLDDTAGFLRSVFIWRKLDKPAQALVAARLGGAREFKLILEQAKLALLAGDDILFDRQLQSARLWLERNGELGSAPVNAALAELEQLEGVVLQPRLPFIGGALRDISELNSSALQ